LMLSIPRAAPTTPRERRGGVRSLKSKTGSGQSSSTLHHRTAGRACAICNVRGADYSTVHHSSQCLQRRYRRQNALMSARSQKANRRLLAMEASMRVALAVAQTRCKYVRASLPPIGGGAGRRIVGPTAKGELRSRKCRQVRAVQGRSAAPTHGPISGSLYQIH